MVDRKQLLADLKPLLKELEADLRARCDEVPQIDADLKQEYEQAKDAGRTSAAFEAWRADLITQVAAAWVLSCVFVRFLEDNELISPPRISGPLHGAREGRGMQRARDERDLYFKEHPTDTDRDYLLAVFDDLAKLPGAKDIFGAHNPVSAYRDWLSGDAAQKLIEFFQRIDKDETGELIHDFTDPDWNTRFLGDLYQDLSEAARKKYALLQTPEFVEEFILERTLEPAIDEFGLNAPPVLNENGDEIAPSGFRMIDPACGSGHFLLGAFARILDHWRRLEPSSKDRDLVQRTLDSVRSVDINAFAVAVARFRLLVRALCSCNVTLLKDGSDGQRKIDFTLFRGCTQIEVNNTLDCSTEIFLTHQQVIFRKRTNDLLSNPKADRLFTQIPTREFILFGVGLETSIKALALSLLAREKKVTVLVDACGYWSRGTADLALRLLGAKGCGMLSVSELLQRRLDRTQCYRARSNGHNRSSNGFRAGHLSGQNGSGRNGSTPQPQL